MKMAFWPEMDVSRVLGVFALTLLVCFYFYSWLKCRNLPPGPMGLPLVGYIFFLGKKPNVKLMDIGVKYGGVFSFYIGPQLNICVTEYRMIKEMLKNPMTLLRPQNSLDILPGRGGFGGMNGEEWREQRRFTMQTMRNLGLGKGLWETMIQEDAVVFGMEMGRENGKPIYFYDALSVCQITNILSLVFGRHLNRDDEKEDIKIMMEFGKIMVDHISSVDVKQNVTWIMKMIKFLNVKGYQDFVVLIKKVESIFDNEVKRRMELLDDPVKDDFIGCYLEEMKKSEGEPDSTYTRYNLVGNMFALFGAGYHTTLASMAWLFLLMAKYQDIQKKICNEIDTVIGRTGIIYYDDRTRLPYTMASILEMSRWASIGALFPTRLVSEAFSFNGYEIPQGAHVICNSWAMQHDPTYFKDPDEYRPERFIAKDGSVFNVEGYGAFSFGKRNCPGEGIANMTLLLYFATVMQKFHITTPDGTPPNMDYEFSAGIMPHPQKLCFIER